LQLTVTPQPPAPTGLACYETATFNVATCQWDVTGTPTTCILYTDLQAFPYCPGIPSDIQTFSVSGTSLVTDVTITAPNGFEIRKTGQTIFTPLLTLPIDGNGTLVTTSVDIRVAASATVTMTAGVSMVSGADTVTLTVTATAVLPEIINVQGNTVNIFPGDGTPNTSDGTQFGNVTVNTPVTKTYTIQNTSTTRELKVSALTLAGPDAAAFSIGTIGGLPVNDPMTFPFTILPSNSPTFTVIFTSTTGGLKSATVIITSDDDCNVGN